MIKEIKIYDMDGTIVDSSHRYETEKDRYGNTRINLAHWRSKDHAKHIWGDTLLPLAAQYKADLLNPEIYVIIATARACAKGDANYNYIAYHLGVPNKFVHRMGAGDNRGGANLKIDAIKPLLNLKPFKNAMVTVFEDNIDYLIKMCHALNAAPVFVPSNQGY